MDYIGVVKMKKIKIIIFSMFLLVILNYNVNAFGVSSPYWDENPLLVYAGETKEITMVLQNMVGGEDMTLKAELNSGKEIATLTDQITTYNVPFGTSNIPVHLRISIPADAKPGQEWPVGISFKTITENRGGVTLGGAIDKGFRVKVIERPQPTTSVYKTGKALSGLEQLGGFVILVVILLILILVIKYFHKKKENK